MKRSYYVYNGKRISLSELAKSAGISVQCLRYRLISGWPLEKAVTIQPKKLYEYKGEQYTVEGLAKLNGTISLKGAYARLYAGWSIEDIVEKPNEHLGRSGGKPKCKYDCFSCPYPDCIYY